MKVEKMDQYFSFEILRRGYDYYKKGKVKEIVKRKDSFVATVSGSEPYQVTIIFNKNKYEMNCTCPYAEDDNCKHMAAVLYCLKNNNLPIKEESIAIKSEEITSFEKFKREFKKECYKLFHNRSYLHTDELEDYIHILNQFIKEGTKYIGIDHKLAYQIFEFFIMEVDALDVYDEYGKKEILFAKLFESYQDLWEDEKIFVKLLAFIGTIYTLKSDTYYFEHKENMLNLLYQYLKYDWQAEDILVLLRKLDQSKDIYDFQKRNIKIKIIFINYYFIDKKKGLRLAEQSLDLYEVCEFLLDIYKDNQEKQIELLEKMIVANKGHSNEIYYDKLIAVYKKVDKKKYLDLLSKHFIEHGNIKIYRELKNNYGKDEWNQIKKEYLNQIKDSRLYRDICVEEEYYDELVKELKNEWIEVVNNYIKILAHHRPKEILELYKDKLLVEIDRSSCRQHYQKILSNFNYMLKLPHGKDELNNIIKYIRENYKNRKALQEEIDFYQETYL